MERNIFRQNIWFRYFLQILFVATVYFILARLSLSLQFERSNATPVWPPSGFAFAMILLWGIRVSPGILFGAFAANLIIFISQRTVDYPIAVLLSSIIAMGNAGEALLGNYLLRKFIPNPDLKNLFSKTSALFYFSITALIMTIFSSLVGTLAVASSHIISSFQFPIVFVTWWLGDFSGIILITILILVWYGYFAHQKESRPYDNSKLLESILVLLGVVVMTGVVFQNWFMDYSLFNFPYWIIPVYVWAALRFQQKETITVITISAIMAIMGTVHHKGTFGHLTLNEALISLQAFISMMVMTKMALNITVQERKKTEHSLREIGAQLEERVKKRTSQLEERNHFVETIFNSSIDSILVLDQETRCLSINKIAKFNLRIPFPDSIIGKKFNELPESTLPIGSLNDIKLALQGDMVHRSQIPSPVSDAYFEIDYIPLHNPQGVYAVLIIARDVTQRIQYEKELQEQKVFAELLIESSPYMIMAYDQQYRITAWNKRSEDHNNLLKKDVLGKDTFQLFPQYDNEKWKGDIDKVLTNGESLHYSKIKFINKPGWGESFITPLMDSTGKVIGVLSITRDITDLVRMTNSLEEKNSELVKTNEELSSFAYVASHDLQEPLRKIQMFSKRITDSEHNLSPTSQDYFSRMKNAAYRMQQLIEDLLVYSRTGSQKGSFVETHLSEIVQEVREELRDDIAHTKARIIATDLSTCYIIPFQFRQLLLNLVGNSIKFARQGVAPEITITSSIGNGDRKIHPQLENDKTYCHVTVSDNGIGFDPTFSEQIFRLFQRLHGKTEYPGTGIGLAICKKIIENHHGVIFATGRPGEGAIFTMYIPQHPR